MGNLGIDFHYLRVDILVLGTNCRPPVLDNVGSIEADDVRDTSGQGDKGRHETKGVHGCHVGRFAGVLFIPVDGVVVVQNVLYAEGSSVVVKEVRGQGLADSLCAQNVVQPHDGKDDLVVQDHSTIGTELYRQGQP